MAALTSPVEPFTRLSPRRGAAQIVAGAAAIIAAAAAVLIGQTFLAALGVLVLVVVVVGALVVFRRPDFIIPICLMSTVVEALGAGQITVGRLVAGAALALIGLRILTTDWRPPSLQMAAWLPVFLLMAWAWAGTLYAEKLSTVLTGFFILLLGVSFWMVFAFMSPDRHMIDRYLLWWSYLQGFVGVLSVLAFFLLGGGTGGRVTGLSGGPNDYAANIVASLMVILYLLKRVEGRERLALLIIIPIQTVALGASGSRGGLIMMAVAGVYAVLTYPGLKWWQRILAAVAGVFGGLLFFLIMLAINPTRFSLSALLGGSDRGAGRVDLWSAGVQSIKDHFVTGSGLGGFREKSSEILQKTAGADLTVLRQGGVKGAGAEAHNLYLTVLIDIGVIGFALYFGAFFQAMWNLFRRWRTDMLCWTLLGLMVGLMVNNMFGSQLNNKLQWIIIGLSASMMVRTRSESVVPDAA
jgi:O-antigen ligase